MSALETAANEALQALWQYHSDLLYPPEGDSLQRRKDRALAVAMMLQEALAEERSAPNGRTANV